MRNFKELKFAVVSLMAVPLILLSSCSTEENPKSEYVQGSIEYLSTLLENGTITDDILMNISALRTGEVIKAAYNSETQEYDFENIDYVATPVEDELTEEQQLIITETWTYLQNENYISQGKSDRVQSTTITKYYGTYNGYIIVETYSSLVDGVPDILETYFVGDYFLGYKGVTDYIIGWTAAE